LRKPAGKPEAYRYVRWQSHWKNNIFLSLVLTSFPLSRANFFAALPQHIAERLCLSDELLTDLLRLCLKRRSLPNILRSPTVSQRLTAMCCGKATNNLFSIKHR